jgi:hypothetical protein
LLWLTPSFCRAHRCRATSSTPLLQPCPQLAPAHTTTSRTCAKGRLYTVLGGAARTLGWRSPYRYKYTQAADWCAACQARPCCRSAQAECWSRVLPGPYWHLTPNWSQPAPATRSSAGTSRQPQRPLARRGRRRGATPYALSHGRARLSATTLSSAAPSDGATALSSRGSARAPPGAGPRLTSGSARAPARRPRRRAGATR